MVIGTFVGLLSGYFSGRAGAVLFRLTEWFLVIPFLPLAIVLASVLGLATGHGLTALVGYLLEAQRSLPVTGRIWVPAEAWIPVAAVAVATLAALIPAVAASRVDVAHLLNSR